MTNPKTTQTIKSVINQVGSEQAKARMGVIAKYDKVTNTATVFLTGQDSDEITDIVSNVLCPVTMGVQTVAPEPGRPCWVVFRGGMDAQPMITHYFNHSYRKYDYGRTYSAPSSIPHHILAE